jgi:tyrosyl-tRNA synthetase
MKLSEELQWRGLLYQTTIKDFSIVDENKVVFYHGFDASAPSQTIGNLASMMLDRVFLRHGHKCIVLAGGATSLVGDAGGKDTERDLQAAETIAHNVEKAKSQLKKIYGQYSFTLVNNIDWTGSISMLDFLRDVGKYYNVGEMIKKDIVVNRIGEGGSGISYAEFSYALLQGNDYLYLFDNYNCTLQLCGADQWTNCVAGVELIRRKRGFEVHVLTNPLIINHVTGKKFGKSESGAVWLDPEMTSPYDFYQFWMNTDDIGCREYVKIYTDIMPDEYDTLIIQADQDPSGRFVQKYLAYHVTKLVHGQVAAESSRETAENLFSKEIDINDSNIPEISVSAHMTTDFKLDLVEMLAESGTVKSKREARELIDAGAITIGNEKITMYVISVPEGDLLPALIRIGKKKYYRIVK